MSIFFMSLSPDPSASWQPPQNFRSAGRVGGNRLGFVLCSSGASWQRVQGTYTWADNALVLAMFAWHAWHSSGVSGGIGSWGSWHEMHGLIGLCDAEMICGKPVGREGRYS